MNNSFERLIEGMTEALRREVIPHLDGEFARGQVFGVIFMLNNLKMRAGWTQQFLGAQIDALSALANDLTAVEDLPADMPRVSPPVAAGDAPTVEARDIGDGQVAALIDWLGEKEDRLPPASLLAVNAAIDAYLKRQIRHELITSAKPMFAEISLGREQQEKAAG